jgi:hypothetical protein
MTLSFTWKSQGYVIMKSLRVALFVAVLCSWASPSLAVVMFSETFNGSGLPSTLSYSATAGAISWSINGSNQLFADYVGPGSANATAITTAGFASSNARVIYSLDVGIPSGASYGNYNAGMQFGGYSAVFHPGLSGGAFRMENGFSTSNQNMGYTPLAGTLQHMQVSTMQISPSLLAVDVTISGLGADSLSHAFTYSFLDTTPNLGTGTFGGRHSGGASNTISDTFFDNFQVEHVPEPTTAAILGLGIVVLAITRTGKRRTLRPQP